MDILAQLQTFDNKHSSTSDSKRVIRSVCRYFFIKYFHIKFVNLFVDLVVQRVVDLKVDPLVDLLVILFWDFVDLWCTWKFVEIGKA